MKKNLLMNKTTMLALGAVVLLGASAIGSTSAARTAATNEAIFADFETANVDTSLVKIVEENGVAKSVAITTDNILDDITEFHVGQEYEESVAFVNGTVDSFEAYARVTITKNWWSGDVKDQTLDPALIQLTLAGLDNSADWIKDTAASTEERSVYYYKKPVQPGQVVPVLEAVSVLDSVVNHVTAADAKDGVKGDIVTTYNYNGKSIGLNITVDEIQTHNAADAALASWGVFIQTDANGIVKVGHTMEEVQ